MALTQRCSITSVIATIALLVGREEATVRQHVRAWCYEAARNAGAKRGGKRQALDVTTWFVPLLRQVLAWWTPTESRVALAMDARTSGQRFTVLAISRISRGCAIPMAWVVLPATVNGAWRTHWELRFTLLQPGAPTGWTVIVMADRGW